MLLYSLDNRDSFQAAYREETARTSYAHTNEAGTVTRFVHSLMGKMRQWGVRAVILILEEETDKKVISQLSQFVDKVREVK